MRARTLSILAICTALAVVAAAIAIVIDRRHDVPGQVGQNVFPDLIDRVNEVSRILIAWNGGTITVERRGDYWALVESDGYPIDRQAAQRTVVEFTEMQYLAPKTQRPDRYERLQVRDPEEEGARSKLVRLFAADGDVLAEAIVGQRRYSVPGVLPGGLYIRLPGDPQAWLVSGGLEVDTHPRAWLATGVINIARNRVDSVVIEHPEGDVVRVRPESASEYGYAFADIPEGKQAVFEGAAQYIAGVLERLAMEDVRKVGNAPFEESAAIVGTFHTSDGLVVRLTVDAREDRNWSRFHASVAPDAPDAAKAAEEAEALNARLGGWVFQLPNHRLADFKKRQERLLEDAPSG